MEITTLEAHYKRHLKYIPKDTIFSVGKLVESSESTTTLGIKGTLSEEREYVACVVKRLLVTPRQLVLSQCKKIFHSQCSVNNKVCTLIIDNESYDNIISKSLARHLKLQTETHPTLYKLGWIKEGPIVTVTENCRVLFSIEKSYKEEVIHEVVDMDACHVLLGRPW